MLPEEQRLAANTLASSLNFAATIAGPAIARLLVTYASSAIVIGLDALTYAFLAVLLAGTRLPKAQGTSPPSTRRGRGAQRQRSPQSSKLPRAAGPRCCVTLLCFTRGGAIYGPFEALSVTLMQSKSLPHLAAMLAVRSASLGGPLTTALGPRARLGSGLATAALGAVACVVLLIRRSRTADSL